MPLVSVGIIPHGAMVLDPSLPNLPEGASYLHDACQECAKAIRESRPDVIILISPHGISLSDSVVGPFRFSNYSSIFEPTLK